MATFVYRPDRALPWLVRIKRKGHLVYSKSFRLKPHGEKWARQEEDRIEQLAAGLPDNRKYLETKVSVLAARYLAEISPTKLTFESEKYIINNFINGPMARKPLNLISTQDGAHYRNERLGKTYREGKTIKPSTVRREINILQHIFKIAKTEWGYSDLRNPFEGLRIQNSDIPRDRRVSNEELDRLSTCALKYCRGMNKLYVNLAICLAVTTGMRLQEIFNLELTDVYPLRNRRIVIRKSKTDNKTKKKGRTIVMSPQAHAILMAIIVINGPAADAKLFPMTKKAFKQSWNIVKRQAGLTDLTFHDLRHEAASRFAELDLNTPEADLMLGHKNRDMNSRYTHIEDKLRQRIQEKMDKFMIDSPIVDDNTRELLGWIPSKDSHPLPTFEQFEELKRTFPEWFSKMLTMSRRIT